MTPRFRQAAAASLLALALLASAPAPAQDESGVDDVMMSVIEEDEANEETFAEEIRLPGTGDDGRPEEARDAGDLGRESIDDARELRDGSGAPAESVRDLGGDARERSQEDRP